MNRSIRGRDVAAFFLALAAMVAGASISRGFAQEPAPHASLPR